ncbi:dnaJ-like subfamily C member 17 [Solea senegalensis]|uniref:DnaJ homolog subfamily C member 17 n=1 Tax=Solea senegalensis TaxID=28829 RepID=A0AAV6PCV8_SOLSE|nr:dnaJ homolog subfamily C member 17 [Solea senegalensis]KAG7454916.1 dnaJ-like subfamily C member 17 [Solea senegalensis]
MSKKASDILQMDLYGLLGVESTATTKQIKKAYRKKALQCHPDKNPDNPKAADLFHQLAEALEVLTDAAAKAAYDKICTAKRKAEERNRKLDDKRKKMKLELETRERDAKAQEEEEENNRKREAEIARLRREGEQMLADEQHRWEQKQREREEQWQRFRTQRDSGLAGCSSSSVTPKLKLKWKCAKDDATNGGYSQDSLLKLLQRYGDVLTVVISSKKKGSALVEFASAAAAELALKHEKGLSGTPLKISWIEGQPTAPVSQTVQFMSSQVLV